MSKAIACTHVVPGCKFTANAATEEELLAKVAEHARKEHGVTDVTPPWVTAFCKTAATGAVFLATGNLAGDRPADLTVHGGTDKAVCVYSSDHDAAWRAELAVDACAPGWFGENFAVDGQTEQTVAIGDIYRVGKALVQVSQPRGPCWKLGRRWHRLRPLWMVLARA